MKAKWKKMNVLLAKRETESYKKYKQAALAELKELRENSEIDSPERYLFEMNKIIGKKRIASRKKVNEWIAKGFEEEQAEE